MKSSNIVVKWVHPAYCPSNKYIMPKGETNPLRGRFGCCICLPSERKKIIKVKVQNG